jgi:sensor histidine kinase YesM
MLLQPFVENVFVHAFDSSSINPTLQISFTQSDNLLVCEIKDNGKGMLENKLNKLYASKGIKLVKERIGLLQINNSNSVQINSSIQEGTSILIKIQLDF